MKTLLRVLSVFVSGCLWILLLGITDKLLEGKLQGWCLPEPLDVIAAVGVSLGPPLVACLVALRRTWKLARMPAVPRWGLYLIVSSGLAVGSLFGGNALWTALGLRLPGERAPGPGDFTEQDVESFITPGRPFEEITNRFGQPRLVNTNGQYLV